MINQLRKLFGVASPKKIFLLGVGAQKAGTTWLYNYFEHRHDTRMGFTKEYHVFDTRTLMGFEFPIKQVQGRSNRLFPRADTLELGEKNVQRFRNFIDNPAQYYDYFAQLLTHSKAHITADFTPSYSALSCDVLFEIKTEFEQRDIQVIPIFLMREPVSRLRSFVKMKFRNEGTVPNQDQELAAMQRICGNATDASRCCYDFTYKNLRNVFGEEKFVGFYETLFCPSEIMRLCELLNINYIEPRFDEKLNASSSDHLFSYHELNSIKEKYRVQYDFAERTFGKQFIDSIWRPAFESNIDVKDDV